MTVTVCIYWYTCRHPINVGNDAPHILRVHVYCTAEGEQCSLVALVAARARAHWVGHARARIHVERAQIAGADCEGPVCGATRPTCRRTRGCAAARQARATGGATAAAVAATAADASSDERSYQPLVVYIVVGVWTFYIDRAI